MTQLAKTSCMVTECKNLQYNKKTSYCVKHLRRIERYGSTHLPNREPTKTICQVEDCGRRIRSQGLCSMHEKRLRVHGSLNPKNIRAHRYSKEQPKEPCDVQDCLKDKEGRKYCSLHSRRLREHNSLVLPSKEKPCKVKNCKEISKKLGLCNKHYKRSYTNRNIDGIKECRYCESPFHIDETNCGIYFCSTECKQKQRKGYTSVTKRKYYQTIKNQYRESVNKSKVFEKDNYICQLCFDPVIQVPNYKSHKKCKDCETVCFLTPSLDHIIPLSRGGEHSYANTQTAHLICNILKKNIF